MCHLLLALTTALSFLNLSSFPLNFQLSLSINVYSSGPDLLHLRQQILKFSPLLLQIVFRFHFSNHSNDQFITCTLEETDILVVSSCTCAIDYRLPNQHNFFLLRPAYCSQKDDCSVHNNNCSKLNLKPQFELNYAHKLKSLLHLEAIPLANPMDLNLLLSFSSKKWDFDGMEIVAIAKKDSKLLEPDGTYDMATFMVKEQKDVAVAIFLSMRDMLNFTVKPVLGSSIAVSEEGQMSGKTFDLLTSGHADIFIEQTTLIPEEASIFAFLQPIEYGNGIMAIFVQPSIMSVRNVLVDGFSWDMWVATGCLAISIGLFVRSLKICIGAEDDYEFHSEVFLWIFSALCQRGWPYDPKSIPLRIITAWTLLCTYIVYSAYSAIIFSVLSVEQIPVKVVEDLVHFNYHFYAFHGSKTTQSFLQDYLIPHHNLTQKLELFNEKTELLVLQSPHGAILSYDDKFYGTASESNISDDFICKRLSLLPAKGTREPTMRAMLVPKGSPFQEVFNQKAMLLRERGLIHRYLTQNENAIKPRCMKSNANEVHSFDMRDVFIAFAILGTAVALSLGVLIAELQCSCFLKQRRKMMFLI